VISSFLVLVVGEADHEHQKSDLFRGLRPRNLACGTLHQPCRRRIVAQALSSIQTVAAQRQSFASEILI
jgi:hypothetical protein